MTLTHDDWMDAAAEEYQRLDTLLAGLEPRQWALATDCDGWSVRDVVAHLVGAAEATARVRTLLRQRWAARGRPSGLMLVDAMNAVQVSERSDWDPGRLRAALADAGARSVRARRRVPALVRAAKLPLGAPLGVYPLGRLLDCIYTRDAWMHRIDLARVTGVPLTLTPDHDGAIVDDVVREWADSHGRPFSLFLGGLAGGDWSRGSGGDVIDLDAVEFCRVLSGRTTGPGLLAHPVVF